jgi:hypothetical protein
MNVTHTHSRLDSCGRGIGSSQRQTDSTQHSRETDSNALGIRTRNPKRRAAADQCLRTCDHRDWLHTTLHYLNLFCYQKVMNKIDFGQNKLQITLFVLRCIVSSSQKRVWTMRMFDRCLTIMGKGNICVVVSRPATAILKYHITSKQCFRGCTFTVVTKNTFLPTPHIRHRYWRCALRER